MDDLLDPEENKLNISPGIPGVDFVEEEKDDEARYWRVVDRELMSSHLKYFFNNLLSDHNAIPLAWLEKHWSAILIKFRERVDQRAQRLYDDPITITSIYQYSPELYTKLQEEMAQFRIETSIMDIRPLEKQLAEKDGVYAFLQVEERDFLSPRTNRQIHDILVRRVTTIRRLTGDYVWEYAKPGTVRTTDVRRAFKREIGYLFKQSGTVDVHMNFGGGVQLQQSRQGVQNHIRASIAELLPIVYPGMVKGAFAKKRFFDKHPQYRINMDDVIYTMYRMAGAMALKYFDRALENETMTDWGESQGLHDAVYPFNYTLFMRALTAKSLQRVLQFHPDKVQRLERIVTQIITLAPKEQLWKEHRQMVKRMLMTENPEQTLHDKLNRMMQEQEKEAMKGLNLSLEKIQDFAERLRRYAPTASIPAMVKDFGKQRVAQMIRGTYPGLFEPQSFAMPLQFVGHELRRGLGRRGKGAQVKNPKRLYHHLSKLGDVKAMVEGQIKDPQAVLHVLSQMGLSLPKEYEQVLSLQAKIEPKCSPEYLVAGDASVCCMSFGADNAKQYAVEKGFGILNVYLGDRIIANSVLWINELLVGRALVIDNIELAPNYKRFALYVKDLFLSALPELMRRYDCIAAAQGGSFNDVQLPSIGHLLSRYPWQKRAVGVMKRDFYSDASFVTIVATLQSAEEMEAWDEEMSELQGELQAETSQLMDPDEMFGYVA